MAEEKSLYECIKQSLMKKEVIYKPTGENCIIEDLALNEKSNIIEFIFTEKTSGVSKNLSFNESKLLELTEGKSVYDYMNSEFIGKKVKSSETGKEFVISNLAFDVSVESSHIGLKDAVSGEAVDVLCDKSRLLNMIE
jgi:hypothetical protein